MKIKYSTVSLGIFALSLLAYSIIFATNASASLSTKKIVNLTNTDRAASKLPEVRENQSLDLAAQLKLDDMVANGYFAHNSPQGVTPWYFFHRASYDYQSAGENLAINFTTSTELEQAWMNSTEHRLNILNPKFTDIGIAAKEVELKGKRALLVVEYFGSQQNQNYASR